MPACSIVLSRVKEPASDWQDCALSVPSLFKAEGSLLSSKLNCNCHPRSSRIWSHPTFLQQSAHTHTHFLVGCGLPLWVSSTVPLLSLPQPNQTLCPPARSLSVSETEQPVSGNQERCICLPVLSHLQNVARSSWNLGSAVAPAAPGSACSQRMCYTVGLLTCSSVLCC